MPQIHEWEGRPTHLAERLRGLRRGAGLTGTQVAERLGWVQSKVSRIETGNQIPSAEDVRAWVAAVGGSPDLTEQLLGLLAEVRASYQAWRRQLRESGLGGVQVDYDKLGQQATTIRTVEVSIVPGLLQTADYARSRLTESASWFGLGGDDIAAAVAARMRRQQILYDTTKRFEFVITEGVLRTLVCPVDVMVAQLDRLATLVGLPHIRLGIIPFGVSLQAVPLHGFSLWDDLAIVETYDAELLLRAADARIYATVADALMASARVDEDAQRLIRRAVDDLRASG